MGEWYVVSVEDEEVLLGGEDGFRITSVDGGSMAPVKVFGTQFAVKAGETQDGERMLSRGLYLSGNMIGSTEPELNRRVAAVLENIKHDRLPRSASNSDPFLLRYAGQYRTLEIPCKLEAGWAGQAYNNDAGYYRRMVVRMRAQTDPQWRALDDVEGYLGHALQLDIAYCAGRCGHDWFRALGAGLGGGAPLAVADGPGGLVYWAGTFTTAGGAGAVRVAVWDSVNETWAALGAGCDATVYAIAVAPDGRVYVGGDFANAGGAPAVRVAVWDPDTSTWAALGAGCDATVRAIWVDHATGLVYFGGDFANAGGAPAAYIATWDPDTSTWAALGAGCNGSVRSICGAPDGRVYASGTFTTAGGAAALRVAVWDPDTSTWAPLGAGCDGTARVVRVDNNRGLVYFGGDFANAGGAPAVRVAVWDPDTETWAALGAGCDNVVTCLSVDALSGCVYACGTFLSAGGVAGTLRVAMWDPVAGTWADIDGGADATVYCVAVSRDGRLYAGGTFTTAGGVAAAEAAAWCVSMWSDLAGGIAGGPIPPPAVSAWAAGPDGLMYAGGYFTSAGGGAANSIAAWDPVAETWAALGAGITGGSAAVYAIAIAPDGRVYVGGSFTTAGGGAAANVAVWDPVAGTWSALGAGTNNAVHDIVIGLDGLVYFVGAFTTAGGGAANYVASWDPVTSTWAALGVGTNGVLHAAAVGPDGRVYVGGSFTLAGGAAANYIAVWDPAISTWAPLGTGMNNWVEALVVGPDGMVYAGGQFTTAGGVTVNRLARWDGLVWYEMAGGTSSTVYGLAISSKGLLYIGGLFGTAGDLTLTDGLAIWNGYTYLQADIDLPLSNVYALGLDSYDRPYLGTASTGGALVSCLHLIRPAASADSYPAFWVYGPATLSTIINETTEQSMHFDMPVIVGETVTVSSGVIGSDWGRRITGQPRPGSDSAGFYLYSDYDWLSVFALDDSVETELGIVYRDLFHGFESGDVP